MTEPSISENPDRSAGAPPPRAWLLAIDSSTEQAGVALFDGQTAAEISWAAGRSQTTSLLGEIDHLLRLHGVGLPDLAAIAVATGPGAFSALRVGIGVAKGLVLAHAVPLIGVPTLDVVADPFRGPDRSVCAVVAAGRSRLVWGVYRETDGIWGQTSPPVNGTPAELTELCLAAPGTVVVTGELPAELARELSRIPGVAVPPASHRTRRPAVLAELALARWIERDADDPASLEPLYLHGRQP